MPPPPIRPVSYYEGVFAGHPIVSLSLATLGAVVFFSHALKVLRVLLQTFVVRGKSVKKFGVKEGAWAVVTGATDGIGREFALQLAAAGFNILLASRSPEKLGAVAGEIESKYGVKTTTHTIDFARPDRNAYNTFETLVRSLEIGVLVNNVGKSYDMPTDFADMELPDEMAIVEINVNATLRVTKIVVQEMIERKSGLILNIGSFSGAFPSPMLSVYSGTKAFLTAWSQSLGEELKPHGIVVELVNTYFVVSSLSKIRRPNLVTPRPKEYVQSVLARIGVPCGALGRPYTSTPYWSHSIGDWLVTNYVPKGLLLTYINGMHQDIRRRALRKMDRIAKGEKKD